ncbi:hypothetical protein KQI65_16365 [bacterium]|nr:hypothetical protein [bacterium]
MNLRTHTMILRTTALVFTAVLLLSCQSPMERPPTEARDVVVHVQTATGRPIELVPVEVYDLAVPQEQREALDREMTDQAGNSYFRFVIPTTGGRYRFVVGNEQTGVTTLDANLLCRDTLMIVELVSEELPCSGTIDRTLRIDDVCAPLSTGEMFTDSAEVIFRNGCDVPMTYTLSGPGDSPAHALFILDADGNIITDRPFTVDAMGQMTLRAVATPEDSSLQVLRYTLSGMGPNQAAVTINLTVEIEARNCNFCTCPEDEIIIDFGSIQAEPEADRGESAEVVSMPRNSCLYDRIDDLIKQATQNDVFSVTALENLTVPTGSRSSVTVTFRPKEQRSYRDTLLIEHFLPEEQRRCTTRVILQGEGCGPACELVEDPRLVESATARYDFDMGRVRVYEGGRDQICFMNVGDCGVLELEQDYVETPGFTVTPSALSIDGGETGCFSIVFDASDEVVWPDGHGQPAKTLHEMPMLVRGCGPRRDITVHVIVDTLPILFSRCIYQWDQNGNYGYNFTPVGGKGEDRYDPDALLAQITDLVVISARAGNDAEVRIRSGWKHIKDGVSEAQFNYTDMSTASNGWSMAEFRSITSDPFDPGPAATLDFRSVYSIRIERNGVISYACVRVREISMDPDGKFKLCLDVLYPMIKEN